MAINPFRKGGNDTIPVSEGGTGATTGSGALTNLGGLDVPTHASTNHQGIQGAGKILQIAYQSTGSQIQDTVGIPLDNSIPQITEGTECLQIMDFTPVDPTSYLFFDIVAHSGFLNGGGGHLITTLHQVGVNDALAVADSNDNHGGPQSVNLMHWINAAGAGARTYTVRFGSGTPNNPQPNNAILNADFSFTGGLFGGRMVTAMRIIEYAT